MVGKICVQLAASSPSVAALCMTFDLLT